MEGKSSREGGGAGAVAESHWTPQQWGEGGAPRVSIRFFFPHHPFPCLLPPPRPHRPMFSICAQEGPKTVPTRRLQEASKTSEESSKKSEERSPARSGKGLSVHAAAG